MGRHEFTKSTKNLFKADSQKPFKLSRSKIDLFLECPRCFYFDRKLGISRPPTFPFTLNSAVDTLLKLEFDIHRARGEAHPIMKRYGLDAIPIDHENLKEWRHNFTGIQFFHQPTNFLIFGAIDDLWQNSQGEYIVVDYKATSKNGKIIELNQKWQISYKRQMEVYQWLLRQNGYQVSETGYFIYCNGQTDKKAFDGKLEFEVTLIPYRGDDIWVEQTIFDIYRCLKKNKIPSADENCSYCQYRQLAYKVEQY